MVAPQPKSNTLPANRPLTSSAQRFAAGTLVEYGGARWRVQRALGVEAVLLRSDTGEEVSADPLKVRLAERLKIFPFATGFCCNSLIHILES